MWLTAFLDLPAPVFDDDVSFWLEVTDTELSAPRGEHGEFASLLPATGDPWLKVQRLHNGPPRIHLDVHPDPSRADSLALQDQAVRLGATRLASDPVAIFASPGGLVFCVVTTPLSALPPVPAFPHLSLVDQVCLDIPRSRFDSEAAFWSALLGGEVRPSPTHEEFSRLSRQPEDGLKVLLQRCDDDGPVRAHLDLATTDRDAEVMRLMALGAVRVRETPQWTTLRDPAGLEFCVTRRPPR
jgi:hypothetical protein